MKRLRTALIALALFTFISTVAAADTIGPKQVLPETSNNGPGIVIGVDPAGGLLLISWTGTGNNKLNFQRRLNGNLLPKVTSAQTSTQAPAVAYHQGRYFAAWSGVGNNKLNVMSSADGVTWGGKVTLDQTSESGPAMAVFRGRLYLSWRGVGNNKLNVMSSADGVTWGGKVTLDQTTTSGPSITGGPEFLHIAWRGVGNNQLNVIRGDGTTFTNKVTLTQTTTARPAIQHTRRGLVLAWQGVGNDQINLMVSHDAGLTFGGKTTSNQTSYGGPALTEGTIAWTGTNKEHNLNVAPLEP